MEAMRNEKVRLLVVGTGPQEDPLKEGCRKRQLNDKILFMGRVEESEKVRILQMCDLYVSTSQHEGFGLVFLEAMACGLPIVCYDQGGQTDYLENAVTGHLVPLNDLASFEDRCRSLIKDRERRRRIGQENLRRVEDFFVDRCARRYEALFEEVISCNGDGRYRKDRLIDRAIAYERLYEPVIKQKN
jgi:glycosyltransferase involved in cell wall biosynthesis